MIRIECPHCHQVFEEDDEAQFASVLQQVREHEVAEAIKREEKRSAAERESAVAAAVAKVREEFAGQLGERDASIADLKAKLDGAADAEELRRKEALTKAELDYKENVGKYREKIAELEQKLKAAREQAEQSTELAVSKAQAPLVEERDKLRNKLELARRDRESLEDKLADQARDRDEQIKRLMAQHESELEREREFRSRLSVKVLGESLEQHCEAEFNKLRSTAFRTASFEKDNIAVGDEDSRATKGDYIFRDYDEDGSEFVSIMFDMKTDSEASKTRRKNEDHLKKLDEDRRKKGCEYAVLVSTLEPDSELYNQGIVDESWRYEKMYVVRPQFFVPIITLLRDANLRSVDLRRQLAEARSVSIDITNFEQELQDFQGSFADSVLKASKKFDNAMDDIDKAIRTLEKIKESFRLAQKHLGTANNKAESLTIKKLTKGSPSLRKRFEELPEGDS